MRIVIPKHQTVRTQLRETRYLVLDDRIIDEVVAAELTLGEVTKHPQNPLFGVEVPASPCQTLCLSNPGRKCVTCKATSATVHWHVPEPSGTRLKYTAYRLCPLKT